MKTLQPILQVRELPPACASQRQELPSLCEFVADIPGPHEAAILSYLAQGVECGIYNDPGFLYDVLQPGVKLDFAPLRNFIGPDTTLYPHLLMTDGTWVWPGALLYYLATYHLRLPDAFVDDAARRNWRIDPSTIDVLDLNWDAFDAVLPLAPLSLIH
jgi:hypothetical protein